MASIEENFKTILSSKYESIVKLFKAETEDKKLVMPGLLVNKEEAKEENVKETETPAVEEITNMNPNENSDQEEEAE